VVNKNFEVWKAKTVRCGKQKSVAEWKTDIFAGAESKKMQVRKANFLLIED